MTAEVGVVIDAAGSYVHWGVIQISVTNLLIIVGMVVLFAVALLVPFPGSHEDESSGGESDDGD